MIFRKPFTAIFLIPVLLTITSACSSVPTVKKIQLAKQSFVPERLYDIFDISSVTGTGLKIENQTYQPKRCIKSADTSVTGGQLTFEFIDPASDSTVDNEPYGKFIKSAVKRASLYNLSGMSPFSVVCLIRVSGKMNYLKDNSIQFTETAENLLNKKDIEGFYSHCGTLFIDSTTFESAAAFVVTYYMPPVEVDNFKKKIRYGKEVSTADITNFSVFNEAGTRYPVFFSTSVDSDNIFIPLEFPAISNSGKAYENFIKKTIMSCLSSSIGKISSYQIKKWSELPDINKYMPQLTGARFPEDSHDRIESLTRDMRDFAIFRLNMNIQQSKNNNELLNALTGKISWKNYYRCGWGISYNGYTGPDQERDCRDLLQGLKIFREIEKNNPLVSRLDGNSMINMDHFKTIRLADKTIFSPDSKYEESEYRFNDKTLYIDIPDKTAPGQTMDNLGKIYSSDCIKKDSLKFFSNRTGSISSIRNDCYPVEFKKWGIFKRIFFFWKKTPAPQPRYRGNLEITGFSKELSDEFTITDEAADLARNDILSFYKKYGTHYVSQIKSRRGIVYYFSTDSEKDISVHPYGIPISSQVKTDLQIPADAGGGGCFSFLGKFMNSDNEDPLLHPSTVEQFFRTKEDFTKLLSDESESIPVEIYLKPWSQYLVERGIIRTDQTIPVTLFDEQAGGATEGIVSVIDSDGDKYEGMLSNGLKNGDGILKTRRGSEYSGTWMGNLMHGKGVYKHKDGNIYSGDFMFGYPHGAGENKGVSGNIYRGDVLKGDLTGKGEMIYKDGRKYMGDFINGEPDGYGIMEFPDGKRLEGSFKKGLYLKKQ